MDWLPIISEVQLEEINQKSFDSLIKGVLIFKHSTRCSISSMSLNRLERKWDFSINSFPAYFLDLIRYRNLSDQVADIYHVEHESPQVLVVKNGKCIFTASHSDINVGDIKDLF
jgi:bacillithiol system protein YtxJ